MGKCLACQRSCIQQMASTTQQVDTLRSLFRFRSSKPPARSGWNQLPIGTMILCGMEEPIDRTVLSGGAMTMIATFTFSASFNLQDEKVQIIAPDASIVHTTTSGTTISVMAGDTLEMSVRMEMHPLREVERWVNVG